MEQDKSRSRYALHIGLFVCTCVTTFLSGAYAGDNPLRIADGFFFSATLMAILLCHEMGHYLVARRHGIDASLPYFIPLPPTFSLGTMGAVIRMRQPITDRNKLIDVGAAGPLAGLAVAIPLMLVGLSLSPVVGPGQGISAGNGVIEGNSLLYIGLKYLVHGRYLPAPDGTDVVLHPVAWAAWVGFLLTMINLLPIGQLDGGHVACGYLGKRHERLSVWLHWALCAVGAGVTLALALVARIDGQSWLEALQTGLWSSTPWFVWAVLLLIMRRLSGGVYHPAVGDEVLTTGRKRLVLFMAVVFLLIFIPIPLRKLL
jgi:membrane-associated protease RseP (regulator of RpoE activity)